MFTHIQRIDALVQQAQAAAWHGQEVSGHLCTFTATRLGQEITRIVLQRGTEVDKRRYPAATQSTGTLPYRSWIVARGDESWSTPHETHAPELIASFASSETALRLIHPLKEKDHIYGLGERTGAMDKRGQAFPVWNVDPPMHHSEQTVTMYISIPFYLCLNESDGEAYGLLLDHTGRVEVDAGATSSAEMTLTVEGDTLVAYIFAGPTPADVVRQYTELTGRMPLPARWTLGLHQSRWGYEDAAQIRELAHNLRTRRHPCDAVWLDIDYMDGYRNFTWHPVNFAQPRQMIEELRQQGLRLVTILDPGTKVENEYFVYQQGDERDYFCRYPDGSYFLGEVWPGACVFPDYTRQDVRDWWGSLYAPHIDLGVAGIWNDMDEPALTTILSEHSAEHIHGKTMDSKVVHWPDADRESGQKGEQLTHRFFHNAYGMEMARATYEGLLRLRPDERPFVLSRSGTGGIQRYATVWTGDNTSQWEHIALAISMCLNLSMSGVAFVGVDIGGFWNDSNGELLVRFAQLGAFLPFCRNHNARFSISQEPWMFGEPFESAYREAIELRYRNLPYLYTLFAEAARTGAPIIRPLYYHYPQNPQALASEDQLLIGESLLSAPISSASGQRSVYLPPGTWFDYWTGEAHDGDQSLTIAAPLSRWPLFVRANSILPQAPLMQYSDEKPVDPLIIDCYLSVGGQGSYTLYEDDGSTQAYTRGSFAETQITVQSSGDKVEVSITESFTGYRPVRTWYEIVVHLDGQIRNSRIQAGQGQIDLTL